MLLSDILGQASDHHCIVRGGMPPILLPWWPETYSCDVDIFLHCIRFLNQSEPVSVTSRTSIPIPPVILISSLPPVQALPPLPAPLPASWPASAPPSTSLSAPLPPPSPLIISLISVIMLIAPAHWGRGRGAVATTPSLAETIFRRHWGNSSMLFGIWLCYPFPIFVLPWWKGHLAHHHARLHHLKDGYDDRGKIRKGNFYDIK